MFKHNFMTIKAVKHAEEINKQRNNGKKFFKILKEYGKKPIF